MSRARRIGRRQLAAVAASLGPVDTALLDSVDRLRLASGRQLERLHFHDRPSGDRQARRHLGRLVEVRLLARLDRRIGGVRAGSSGYVYALDVAGQRMLGTGPVGAHHKRPWTPGAPFLAHALAVTDLYVRLVEAGRRGVVDVLDFATEPRCWRRWVGAGGARQLLKPDAFARLGVGIYEDSWFIEIDRATEAVSTLARKFDAYRRYWQSGTEQATRSVFPKVLWVVPDDDRKAVVVDVAAAQPAEAWPLFRVVTEAEAVTAMTEAQP